MKNYGNNGKYATYGKNASSHTGAAQSVAQGAAHGVVHTETKGSSPVSLKSHSSYKSHTSHSHPQPLPHHPIAQPSPTRLLRPRGDYRTLLSFQKAEIIYDLTFRFAHKFLSRGDRTIDQMIQSARSGKKNLLEASKAGLTPKETEIKLTNVARASLEELLDDYRDYLRARDLKIWDKDSKEAKFIRELGRKTPQSFEDYREFTETRPPEVVANIALCLIHQANYLIDQQLRRLEQDFANEGGLREQMARVRLQVRDGATRQA